MLSKIWCLASCGQFVHLYHLFCMKSNAIFHFYCSLYLLISGALIEFNLFDPSRCSVVRFTGFALCSNLGSHLLVNFGTAAYEIPKWAKLWYRTVWNIIDTGNFTVPVYRTSLQWNLNCGLCVCERETWSHHSGVYSPSEIVLIASCLQTHTSIITVSVTWLCSPLGLELMVKLRTLLTVFTLILKSEARDYGKGRYISDAAYGVRPITMHCACWSIRADCACRKEGLCSKQGRIKTSLGPGAMTYCRAPPSQ